MHQIPSIATSDDFLKVLEYITLQANQLLQAYLETPFPIRTICIFTHSPEEFAIVSREIQCRGTVSSLSYGPTTYVEVDLFIADQHITLLGVREPDLERPQRGYADYSTSNYSQVLEVLRGKQYVQLKVAASGRQLIELRHPDFDVLGYIVEPKITHEQR